ncbi:MAG: flagellar biosynthesis protein FliQ [Candidatus Xenolissoclinum pacificiensis L6]|uniref:Flagellar biosynthetic protein FliQ n=1 Tax=Candidatus Xenolissoclinum pacificiensis L6 TaxID=1401685 RepID=W2V2Y4_9RICK|nr:MAG: flagellar biosynthesis protein FliQ [Candidatus Xenolissoclinum pacificiensis L6]
MQSLEILDISREAIWVLIKVSSPIIISAMIVGLFVSLIQALTQINEATLTFIPKIVVVFFAILIFISFMATTMGDFSAIIMGKIRNL